VWQQLFVAKCLFQVHYSVLVILSLFLKVVTDNSGSNPEHVDYEI